MRLGGHWVAVEQPEMDCGLLVTGEGDAARVRTLPVSDVHAGDRIVCGAAGVRVVLPAAAGIDDGDDQVFEFMNSEVSSEKPQALLVRQIAEEMRATKAAGKRILWVAGPAVVHTGAAPADRRAGRGGLRRRAVRRQRDRDPRHRVVALRHVARRSTCPRAAASSTATSTTSARSTRSGGPARSPTPSTKGVLTGGVMHALVTHDKPFVLVGSVRDDGPLPDVYTDVIEGQRAMRAELHDVGFAIMVATMLHSVATGNLLPASIPLVCVDINPATVTKLADRGSSQARGVVTDIGLFLEQLAGELAPGWRDRLAPESSAG